MENNYCVIMAGGIGSRFWPMSRTAYPKQFLDILGTGRTLLQQTFDRYLNACPTENIYIVTNALYVDLVLEQLPELKRSQVLGEPARRNTAPCIAYACHKIARLNPNANVIVAPSDHLILNQEAFDETIQIALNYAASNDALITLGIKPTRPDTGYGYIQFEEESIADDSRIKRVKTFTEKPSLDIAQDFLKSGDFYWNSGMFIWSISSIFKALGTHLPDIHKLFDEGDDKYNTEEEESFMNQVYPMCQNISIDYGIMEKADNVAVVLAADFGWSDLGTWGSLYTHVNKDEHNNAVIGNNAMLYNSSNCIVNVPNDKLVVLQGLDDYIVVESNNTLLVCKKEDEQKIKQFVNDVRLSKGDTFV